MASIKVRKTPKLVIKVSYKRISIKSCGIKNKYSFDHILIRKDLRQSLKLSLPLDVKTCTIPIAPAASHVLVKQF